MTVYDKNKQLIRLIGTGENIKFLIGADILEEADFKIGDLLSVSKERKNTYIIEKSMFGLKLHTSSTKNAENFARLFISRKTIKFLDLPEENKLTMKKYKVYKKENTNDNYIWVKF